jgi:hypothetical protein
VAGSPQSSANFGFPIAIADDCCIPEGNRQCPLQSLTGGAFYSQSRPSQLQKLNKVYRHVASVHQEVTIDPYDLRNGRLRLRRSPWIIRGNAR